MYDNQQLLTYTDSNPFLQNLQLTKEYEHEDTESQFLNNLNMLIHHKYNDLFFGNGANLRSTPVTHFGVDAITIWGHINTRFNRVF